MRLERLRQGGPFLVLGLGAALMGLVFLRGRARQEPGPAAPAVQAPRADAGQHEPATESIARAVAQAPLFRERRLALVIGHNVGARQRKPLRYAEADAIRFGRVLMELGGFAPHDVQLLSGQPLAVVQAAFADLKARVAEHRRVSARPVFAVVFFSGHSDGEAIELGEDRLSFSDLRALLRGSGAHLRLGVVDSCNSGGLLGEKGGRPSPPFELRLQEERAAEGEVFLASAALHERALESKDIRGGFFSHHFVSGLRGAADRSGDGQVTIMEAYEYAAAQTQSATENLLFGPQSPRFR